VSRAGGPGGAGGSDGGAAAGLSRDFRFQISDFRFQIGVTEVL
jgi:hypothetical protein